MDELISRQTAIDALDKIFPADPMRNDYTQGIACGAALAKTYVEQLPPAQPGRKKGKWIDREGGIATCSECGDRWGSFTEMKYCPSCGAYMK